VRVTLVKPRLAPGGKDRVAPRGALGETAPRLDPWRRGMPRQQCSGPRRP
jgi:hypothetical protein